MRLQKRQIVAFQRIATTPIRAQQDSQHSPLGEAKDSSFLDPIALRQPLRSTYWVKHLQNTKNFC